MCICLLTNCVSIGRSDIREWCACLSAGIYISLMGTHISPLSLRFRSAIINDAGDSEGGYGREGGEGGDADAAEVVVVMVYVRVLH